jgi:hypothetical protein
MAVPAPNTYTEPINVIPNLDQLQGQIDVAIAPSVVLSTTFVKGLTQLPPYTLTIVTLVPLTPAQIAAMQAAIAAHIPNPYVNVVFYASSTLVTKLTPLVGVDPLWTDIASTITTPAFFSTELANMWGDLLGVYSATGAGAKLRLVETDPDGLNSVVVGEWALADTGGANAQLDAHTAPGSLSGLTKRYILQGQLNGALAANLSTCEAALMRGVPIPS